MWDNGRRSIKLDQAECIDISCRIRDLERALTVSFIGCKHRSKDGP